MVGTGRVAAGLALTMALLLIAAASAQAAHAGRRPHLVAHPKHLKPGEQFEVRGSGFAPGEEVFIAECSDRGSFGFPLECVEGVEENGAEAVVGEDGRFSVSMLAAPCPVGEIERRRPRRWCYVGSLGGMPEDEFTLEPSTIISVR